jgi:hypothetical protein
MSASDTDKVTATPDSTTEKFRLIWDIVGRWPMGLDRRDRWYEYGLRTFVGHIARYPESGIWPLLDPKRHGRIRKQLDAWIKSLQHAIDVAKALDDDAVTELTRAGLPQGEDDDPDPARCLYQQLQWAKIARKAVHTGRGQPSKDTVQHLAATVRQLYSEVTGEAGSSYKKTYDDQPLTPFENAVIEIFAVLGLARAEALRAARGACKPQKAKSRV